MIRVILFLTFSIISFSVITAQTDTTYFNLSNYETLSIVETGNITNIHLGQRKILALADSQDSTTLIIGNHTLRFYNTSGNTIIEILNPNKNLVVYNNQSLTDEAREYLANQSFNKPNKTPKDSIDNVQPKDTERQAWSDFEDTNDFDIFNSDDKKFKGHWFSFDWGFNNFVGTDGSLSRDDETEYMDLNTGRSWNINLNIAQFNFPIIKNRGGFVSGFGFEFSNYHFENKNTIHKNAENDIAPDYRFDRPEIELKKNRFQTTFFTVPLLMEYQFTKNKPKERPYIAAGIIGGIRIGSNIKVVYKDDGDKNKYKRKGDDFNLNTFRYGFIARAGYKALSIYSRYYLVQLFEKNKGPELYPIAIGLSLNL